MTLVIDNFLNISRGETQGKHYHNLLEPVFQLVLIDLFEIVCFYLFPELVAIVFATKPFDPF